MIRGLRGRVVHLDPGVPSVEVEAAGVVYDVLVPLVLWPELAEIVGEADLTAEEERPELALHIFAHATANQPLPVLVGFLRRAEREFFRKFTSVEGIGPAKAVRALNISVSTVARAIEQEDRATLTRLPGIGPRVADKIIASLRGKVVAEAAMRDGAVETPVPPGTIERGRIERDTVETIVALGYTRSEARAWVAEALGEAGEGTTVEELTLAVLRGRDG